MSTTELLGGPLDGKQVIASGNEHLANGGDHVLVYALVGGRYRFSSKMLWEEYAMRNGSDNPHKVYIKGDSE